MEKIKCGKCPYFTGIQCHGHGEFWGDCNAINMIRKMIATSNNINQYDIKLKNTKGRFDEILYEDSDYILFKIK